MILILWFNYSMNAFLRINSQLNKLGVGKLGLRPAFLLTFLSGATALAAEPATW
jgi:hypothetical protein